MTVLSALAAARAVPVEPGEEQARDWMLDELSKQPYAAARPTIVDLIAQAFFDWLNGLFRPGEGDPTPVVLLVVGVVVVAGLVVAALLVFGVPRANRRSRSRAESLFGEADRRSAAELRAAAKAAAQRGDHSLAVLERYRALARGLDERTLVAVFPGTTATGFARGAAAVFPDEREALGDAARAFDGIRYAGRAGTADQYAAVAALDDRIAAASPRLPEPAALA